MRDRPLDSRDRLFIAVLAVQLGVSAILGAAIVRAVDRAGSRSVADTGAIETQGPVAVSTIGGSAGQGAQQRTRTVGGGSETERQKNQTTGVSAGEIKLGGVFTLSGPGDATVALHTVRAYFNMINAQGGVYGRRLTYVTRDDKFDPSVGFGAVKDLAENQGVFSMVSWIAPNTENAQTLNYLQRQGIPFVGNFGQPPEYTTPISYSFTLNWTSSPRLTVRYMAKNLGQRKIALFWVHLSDEIDQIVHQNANEEAAKWGAEIVYEAHEDVTNPSYDADITQASGAGATGIITIMDAFSLSRYWQSVGRNTTYRPTQLGYAFAMDKAATKAIPADYPRDKVYAVQEMELPSNNTPSTKEYIDTVRKYYPRDPDSDSFGWGTELSWLGAKMFVEALRKAGPNPTRQGILDALDSMTNFDSGFAPPYTIRAGPHDFVKCIKAANLTSDKRWLQVTDWSCL